MLVTFPGHLFSEESIMSPYLTGRGTHSLVGVFSEYFLPVVKLIYSLYSIYSSAFIWPEVA